MSTADYVRQLAALDRDAPWAHRLRGVPEARFHERLRQERGQAFAHTLRGPTAELSFEPGDVAARARTEAQWRLQSVPSAAAHYVIPTAPGDLHHPSLNAALAGQREPADVVVFETLQTRGTPGRWWRRRRPDLDLETLWHLPGGRGLAVRRALWEAAPPTSRSSWALGVWLVEHRDLRWCSLPEPLAVEVPRPERPPQAIADASLEVVDGRLHPTAPAASVSVVIPFRDRVQLTRRCLRSVAAQRVPAQVVLVDNASHPQVRRRLVDAVADLGLAARVRWVDYDAPFNHSAQCNLGVAASHGEVLVFLNNDAVLLDPDLLDGLARWARRPGVATVSPRIVDDRGQLVCAGLRIVGSAGHPVRSPVHECDDPLDAETIRSCDGATFACAALSRAAFDALGPLDAARFPNGYNDVDYALRARQAGWRHLYLGHLRAQHTPGGSRARCLEDAQILALRGAHPWVEALAGRRAAREVVPGRFPVDSSLQRGLRAARQELLGLGRRLARRWETG